jgi:hypothetical protein
VSTPTHVEVEDVEWFAGHGPKAVTGICLHDCKHRSQATIAWGPSLNTYELVECRDCGCRAWQAARFGGNGGIPDTHPWLAVAP